MKVVVIIGLFLLPFVAKTQNARIKAIEFKEEIFFASVDRPGDLYLVFKNGEIQKISKDGEKLAFTKYATAPDLFDPRDGVLAFAYFRSKQQIDYLSPDLSVSDSKKIPVEFANKPWFCFPSKNEIWILDSVDLSLKKSGAQVHLIEKDISWKGDQLSVIQLTFLREYQNFLFVLDKKAGVRMINSMGQPIKILGHAHLNYFNFLGEEFYYLENATLHLIDLYGGETRAITLPYPCDFALLTDERLFLVSGKKLEIFDFKP
jgi:hypothetical protein